MNQDRYNKNVDRTRSGSSVDRTTGRTGVDRTGGSRQSTARTTRSTPQRTGTSRPAQSRRTAQSASRPTRSSRPSTARTTRSSSARKRVSSVQRDLTKWWTGFKSSVKETFDKVKNSDAVQKLKSGKGAGKSKKVFGHIGRTVVALLLIVVIAGCLAVGAFGIYVFGFVDDTIDFDLNNLKLNCATTIYVRDESGENWVEYQRLYHEDREWVAINNISQNAINAFVAAEDERFYEHNGVDWKRTFGAFANMFLHFWDTEQGGSTITQQLVKNLTGDEEVSSMRKIREIMRARKVESQYSKDTIMECYLNVIYLNNNVYGIEAASQYYFDKSASELTIAEAASIASITKSPAVFDPTNNMEKHLNRRNWIIKNMRDLGSISQKECDEALASEVELKGKAALKVAKKESTDDTATTTKASYSYFTDTVIEQVIADLMEEKGYTYKYAENMIFSGGLNIYATLDTGVQAEVDKVFTNDSNFSAVYGTKQKAQAAITVMDYEGNIVAIYGGRGEKTENRGLNRALQSKRQPGSTMKPIGAYAPALDTNLITWSTKLENTTFKHNGTTLKNYDFSTSGPVTVHYAVMRSLNLPAARVVKSLKPAKSFEYCTERFGLDLVESIEINGKSFSDVDVSPLALGGLTYGVTTVEMTAAYCTFGNGGIYYEPTTYSYITNYAGTEVLLDNREREGIQAISADTAYIMNRLLSSVVYGSGGTGTASAFGGWDIIGKTGTTSDNKDRWFVGGTPYYMAAVWFGCDTPFAMNSLSHGTNPAQRLWTPIMKNIHKSLEKTTFDAPSGVKYYRYCTQSGGVAKSGCKSTAWGYFKTSYLPLCDDHGGKIMSAGTAPTLVTGAGVGASTSSAASSKPTSSGKTSSGKTSSKAPTSSAATSSGTSSSTETSSEPSGSTSSPPASASSEAPAGSVSDAA